MSSSMCGDPWSSIQRFCVHRSLICIHRSWSQCYCHMTWTSSHVFPCLAYRRSSTRTHPWWWSSILIHCPCIQSRSFCWNCHKSPTIRSPMSQSLIPKNHMNQSFLIPMNRNRHWMTNLHRRSLRKIHLHRLKRQMIHLEVLK